jgi:ADP-sugar diphosphatase
MAHRVNAIDDEIRKCMGQLQSISSYSHNNNQMHLGSSAQQLSNRDIPNPEDPSGWFSKKFGIVFGWSAKHEPTGVPVYFKTEELYIKWDNISIWPPFNDWMRDNKLNFKLNTVVIQSIDMFGARIGFLKASADVWDERGNNLPGIGLIRGGSVAMLVLIKTGEKYFTVLTKQARVPIGKYLYEIPAGMLDTSNNFTGQAATELKQELGIIVEPDKLVDLTNMIYGAKKDKVYPSAGGCDEFMKIFVYTKLMTDTEKKALDGKTTGEEAEGEHIKTKVIPLEELIYKAPDMKALSAVALYNEAVRLGRIVR